MGDDAKQSVNTVLPDCLITSSNCGLRLKYVDHKPLDSAHCCSLVILRLGALPFPSLQLVLETLGFLVLLT